MTLRFDLLSTPLAGLHLLQRKPLTDARGYLQRLFDAEELLACGWTQAIAQVNHTQTLHCGSVRGLHLQLPPQSEMKLITCLRGEVWDVAVDLRKKSPTFLHWHASLLSAENKRSYLIPAGFAHGFQALTDEVEMMYCHSAPYAPSCEMGLNPLDQALAITWPLAITEMSDKDRHWPMLESQFEGVSV
ncbi:dTDP-4-dehydrorhamnose 3,5-epimerase family protein [Undibacterium sp. RuTC16W]|uniref:dTDP-4-dehydrorhamnose 3,5-epimerase family protein n=1 Tax=Undibacterium sp. RuTC16W TaxID=3413048 RepID=UPI003BF41DA8